MSNFEELRAYKKEIIGKWILTKDKYYRQKAREIDKIIKRGLKAENENSNNKTL